MIISALVKKSRFSEEKIIAPFGGLCAGAGRELALVRLRLFA